MYLHFALPSAVIGVCVLVASVAVSATSGIASPPAVPAIAYVDNGIRVMNADGSNSTLVVPIKGLDGVVGPCWSPDSSKLVFWGRLKGNEGLWTVNLNGSGLTRILPLAADFPPFADWSQTPTPDGQYKIVFKLFDDIWVVNGEGSGLQNLTNTPSLNEGDPGWRRDGTGIFADRNDGVNVGDFLLFDVAAAAGGGLEITGETVIVPDIISAPHPRASNVYDLVVYSHSTMGWLRANVIDLASMPWTPELLTSGAPQERWASFSPDDSKVAFHRNGNSGGIFTINLDGTGETRINKNGIHPNWKRR